jgi:hypothetical protein
MWHNHCLQIVDVISDGQTVHVVNFYNMSGMPQLDMPSYTSKYTTPTSQRLSAVASTFSAGKMLCQRISFFCDSCCGIREAEKRYVISSMPSPLIRLDDDLDIVAG